MRTDKLGRYGPDISRVGFGAWATGGGGWGEVDDDDSIAAIRFAIEQGVNWVDTAPIYGRGHSESVVGRALEPFTPGDDVYVFTKCGVRWSEGSSQGIENNLTPSSIRYECEQSLRRLGIERIDVYQFHWPDKLGTPVEESWDTMSELVAEGKVRWAGVSNFDVDLLDRCEARMHVDSLQPPLSLIDRGARSDVIPWCVAHGSGVITYSPMASGLLTGKYDRARVEGLDPGDWRHGFAPFQEPQLSKNLALVGELKQIADETGIGVPTLAVAWVLEVPGVTAAIVGARTPEQVKGWVDASDVDLRHEGLARIDAALERTGVGET